MWFGRSFFDHVRAELAPVLEQQRAVREAMAITPASQPVDDAPEGGSSNSGKRRKVGGASQSRAGGAGATGTNILDALFQAERVEGGGGGVMALFNFLGEFESRADQSSTESK